MRKVVNPEQMRQLELETAALGLPAAALMENAGRAVAETVLTLEGLPERPRILVLVGPGNNGGDGLVAARHLHDRGARVAIYALLRPAVDDAKERLLHDRGISRHDLELDPGLARLSVLLDGADLVLDAVLGTGRARPLTGALADALDLTRRLGGARPIVALDLPTGVDAGTGEVDPHALPATRTIALGAAKVGLLQGDAVDRVGRLAVVDIGIPESVASGLPIDFPDANDLAQRVPRRSPGGHKGTYGRVLIIGGSYLYTGAPILAALGAQRAGAGLVTLACPATIRADLASHTLETTYLPLPDSGTGELTPEAIAPLLAQEGEYRAVLIGSGIGRSDRTADFLREYLRRQRGTSRPTVVDADALTLLAREPSWWNLLSPSTILTPHSGEMARLAGGSERVDRLSWALESAEKWRTTVVLKGAYTVIANPNGRAEVLPFANPALSTAGTGDVLAGTILGMLGQELDLANAALVGGYCHGLAGEIMRDDLGPGGGLASEVAERLPGALDKLRGPEPGRLFRPGRRW